MGSKLEGKAALSKTAKSGSIKKSSKQISYASGLESDPLKTEVMSED